MPRMLGRLFKSRPIEDWMDHTHNSPHDDPPVSFLDESYTRQLLYGPSAISYPEIDPNRDARVLLLCDSPLTDFVLYDSHNQPHDKSPSFNLRAIPNDGHFQDSIVTLNLLKDLAFGSTPMRFAGIVTKHHPIPQPQHLDRTTVAVTKLFKVAITPNVSYPCALVVFISVPNKRRNLLPAHWQHLSRDIAELRLLLSNKLSDFLPTFMREKRPTNEHSSSLAHAARAYFSSDEIIKSAVNCFRISFVSRLRIPRVVCGQKKDVAEELKWARQQYDPGFVNQILAEYSRLRHSNDESTLTNRAVVVSSDKIAARRIVYLLASTMPGIGSSMEKCGQCHFHQVLETVPSLASTQEDITLTTVAPPMEEVQPVRPPSINSVTEGLTGWEIPQRARAVSSNQQCVMPHVVRPSFSSSSLSSSLSHSLSRSKSQSQVPFFDGLKRSLTSQGSMTSLFSLWSPTAGSGGASSIPTSNNAAYLRSLSHSQESPTSKFSSSFARSSVTSLDDFSEHLDLDSELEERTPTAVICHEHSEVKFSVETSQTDDSVIDVNFSNVEALFWDKDQHETSMECEKDDSESSLDPDMVSIDKTSFKVLPPVAGYLPDLHPDFSVQAVPYCRGFEEKLKSAMLRDDLPGETLIVDLDNVVCHQLWLVRSEDETEMWKFGNKKLGPGKPDFDLTSVFEGADEDDSDIVLE
ncbi:Hypothetical protein YALI2_D00384g [Yarrowia lipolytica]|nr:Hypothetical protein YALI2_D00384g [Yarrowia lipolytica]